VLHIITTLDVGGAEMSLFRLVSMMNGDRFKHHVICLSEMGEVGERISSKGIWVQALSMPRGRLTIKGLLLLLRLIRQINPHILQTWMYHADLVGLPFGKLLRVPRISWNIRCSDMDLARYRVGTRITVRLCTMLSPFPDVIIANSKEGENSHRRMGYRAKRWEWIPNGFDSGVFKPNIQAKERLAQELGFDNSESPIFIGYIARFDPMKDHRTFFDAASRLLRERNDVHFVLVGRGVEPKNMDLIRLIRGNLMKNVHLLGERDGIERINAALDIACSVSLGEGFSNAIGEAMACGVPCVVTDVGDSRFIVGDTGLVVNPKDSAGLYFAWKKLLDLGSDRRSELGKAARERVNKCFDIKKIVERYEKLYSCLANERNG
jgi:glycosyltransferase involved in cell wall biosynthesis